MAINFTDSPSNGDTVTVDSRTYTYDSSGSKWKITATTAAPPTLPATASGTIANGDMLIVNSDGTVSAVAGTSAVSGALGAETVFESAGVRYAAAAFDSNANKVVVAYKDEGNSGHGTAVVGTVSNNSISFGTPVVFNAASTGEMAATFDSNSNKIVIIYDDEGNGGDGTAIVGTVSGTSISFGSEAVFETHAVQGSYRGGIVFDSNSNKVVFTYVQYNTDSGASTAQAIVGTVSGTSISFGSKVAFNGTTAATTAGGIAFDSNSNKVVVAYRDGDNSATGPGKAIVGTVSGTSISFGSPTTFTDYSVNSIAGTFDSNSNKVVFMYHSKTGSSSGTTQGKVIVGTVSGTSISFGSEVSVTSGTTYYTDISFDSNANKVVLSYGDVANSWYGTLRVGTVSGTSITLDSAEVFNAAESDAEYGNVFDSNANKVVLFYRDRGNSNYGTARVKQVPISAGTNLTASNYIGVSDAAYANSATATVQLIGSVDDAQSGLTAGQSYYIQNDGTLSTTAGSPSVLAGTAVSATKLIVKSEIAAAAAAGLLLPGGGVTTYANIAALPSSGNTGGDLAFVTDVKAFYGWDGTEWDRIFSGVNTLPEFTTSPAASYALEADGTATTVTVAATDPEGFDVTYSHDTSPSNQAQATITQSGGTFTVTPSTNESNGGTFTARFKAFDGVRTNSASSTFTLSFGPTSISGLIGFWDFGDSSSYGGSGTTWTDISSNSNNITFSGGTYSSSTTAHSVAAMQFAAGGESVGNFEFPTALSGTGSGKAKTVILIYHTPTTLENTLLWSYGSNSSTYAYVLQDGSTTGQTSAINTHSGETREHRVNGNTVLNDRNTSFDAHEQSKYNTAIISGAVFPSGIDFNGYVSATFRKPHHVRALIVYDNVLSTANMQKIHDYYRGILGSANMPAWSS